MRKIKDWLVTLWAAFYLLKYKIEQRFKRKSEGP